MPVFDPDAYDAEKLEGWYVVQECPECGYRRYLPLKYWFEWSSNRRLKSYCEKTGKEVYMINLGWSQESEPG